MQRHGTRIFLATWRILFWRFSVLVITGSGAVFAVGMALETYDLLDRFTQVFDWDDKDSGWQDIGIFPILIVVYFRHISLRAFPSFWKLS